MRRVLLLLTAILGLVGTAAAGDGYFVVPLDELELTEGTLPKGAPSEPWRVRASQSMQPYAVLDGPGEAYVGIGVDFTPWNVREVPGDRGRAVGNWSPRSLVVRTPETKDVTGRLYYPNQNWTGMVRLSFRIPASKASADARPAFDEGHRWHYERLLSRNIPGGAWFRYQLGKSPADAAPGRAGRATRRGATDLAETYDLFTGGRAMSENLQLDRAMIAGRPNEGDVELATLRGINVREFDWGPLVQGLSPQRDALARFIPGDQHAVFFPSFEAASRLSEEFRGQGTIVLQLAEPRSEDTSIIARYEQQIGLSIDAASRIFGPLMIKSIAVTGSDPYYPMGTDVAVLFETADANQLSALLLAKIGMKTSKAAGVKSVSGEVGGVAYRGLASPNRTVSSYVANIDGVVVVTNSLHQLETIGAVARGKTASLDAQPEYTYFRDRYRKGDKDETALLILSDATIRRWCGPRWRIADSRRVREAARLADARARQLDTGKDGETSPYGSLDFLTPIAELEMTKVTRTEADAYNRWRDGYERNWAWGFDPIGLRITLNDRRLAADITVLPLIAGSDYRELIELSQGAKIAPGAGDPHNALGHWIMAINPRSRSLQQANNFFSSTMRGLKTEPLSWLGSSIAIYVDDGPFWKEMAEAPTDPRERERFFERHIGHLPVALYAEVSSGLRLTAFLSGLRGFIEQTVPGMTQWESLTYKDEPYVRISPTERARGIIGEVDRISIYYYATGDCLVVTLSEDLLKSAIDRRLARKSGKAEEKPQPWPGESAALRIDRGLLDRVLPALENEYQTAMQTRAWGNLPILNEWRRRFPDADPIAFHEKQWQTRLVCPGGGKYVWNEKWQTYESTVYGHPGEPKAGPRVPPALSLFSGGEFGLTFENQGLRAKAVLERAKK